MDIKEVNYLYFGFTKKLLFSSIQFEKTKETSDILTLSPLIQYFLGRDYIYSSREFMTYLKILNP